MIQVKYLVTKYAFMHALYTSLVLLLMIIIYVNQLSISHCVQAGGNRFSNGLQGFESSI
jgi:hypothetical protein